MISETTLKGEIACAKFDLRCAEKGIICSKPNLECPYDRVIDQNGKLQRVQIKYANGISKHSEGVVVCRLVRVSHKPKEKKTYSNEIDAVVAYLPTTDQLCWFGPKIFANKTMISIRLDPPKNGQVKDIILLDDYIW